MLPDHRVQEHFVPHDAAVKSLDHLHILGKEFPDTDTPLPGALFQPGIGLEPPDHHVDLFIFLKRPDHILQRILRQAVVRINESDIPAPRHIKSHISRIGHARILLAKHTHSRIRRLISPAYFQAAVR